MKKSTLLLAAGVVIFVQIAVVLSGSEPQNDLKATVEALGQKAEECFLAGDVEGLMQYYCDDVVSMPNFHPMVRGKSELRLMTDAIASTGIKFESLESETVEVQSGGEYVYEIGTFRQSIITADSNEPVKQSGKYLTIWRKEPDGKLKIAVEIYNSNENPCVANRIN